jgi:DNA repair exonuclease SbcCD ATPase subunit
MKRGIQKDGKIVTKGHQLFNVPLDSVEGQMFKDLCHKFRNPECKLKLKFRGRGKRDNKWEHQSIPLSKSQWAAVHVEPEPHFALARAERLTKENSKLWERMQKVTEQSYGNEAAANRGLEVARKLNDTIRQLQAELEAEKRRNMEYRNQDSMKIISQLESQKRELEESLRKVQKEAGSLSAARARLEAELHETRESVGDIVELEDELGECQDKLEFYANELEKIKRQLNDVRADRNKLLDAERQQCIKVNPGSEVTITIKSGR